MGRAVAAQFSLSGNFERYIVIPRGREKIKMRRILLACLALLSLSAPARAGGTAGAFDYYVLSLSWSPNWCAHEGEAKGDPQCAAGAGYGWVLHGLWPQYDYGWPDYCPTEFAGPTAPEVGAMIDIMGSASSVRHQWRKHGVCSGLAPSDFFALSRAALLKVAQPPLLEALRSSVTLPAHLIEDAFLAVNPELAPDGITITCKAGAIQEARICLTRDMILRACGEDVVRDCDSQSAIFHPKGESTLGQ